MTLEIREFKGKEKSSSAFQKKFALKSSIGMICESKRNRLSVIIKIAARARREGATEPTGPFLACTIWYGLKRRARWWSNT